MELYLLVPARESNADRTLMINEQQWCLTGPYSTGTEDAIPNYACVSYVWGAGRLANPLFPHHLMSDQTLPALQAVIRAASPDILAYWVDAFCVPYHQPSRSATLESMGFIYSAADRVVAALGPEWLEALVEMTKCEWLSEELLTSFESNTWISSVWTYQEIVNAQKHFVTSTAPNAPTVEGDTFLDRIGYSLDKYKKRRFYSSFDMRSSMPHLDAFEDLGGDYMVYSAFKRPALQVMFMLDRRVAHEGRNKYYSMMGALTAEKTGSRSAAGEDLPALRKKVISICEEKGDWSFLYSSTVRDDTEPWMPSSEHELRSILPFFIHGSGQSGSRDDTGNVWLEKVLVIRDVFGRRDGIDVANIKDIISKLPLHVATDANVSLDDLKRQIKGVLANAGFVGNGEPISLPYGLFYPQESVQEEVDVDVIIGTELRWMFGRPGMLVTRKERSVTYVPGVLIGTIGAGMQVEEYMLGYGGAASRGGQVSSHAQTYDFQYRSHALNVGFVHASDGGIGSEASRTWRRTRDQNNEE